MINLMEYGFMEKLLQNGTIGIPARITAVHKERYELICEFGQGYGYLKNSVYFSNNNEEFPTIGDFVLIDNYKTSDIRIIKTLDRKSYFSRVDPSSSGRSDQAIAANFDYVFIMGSLNSDFNIKRIERYLTLSWQSGAIPVVILTKADLVDDFTEQVSYVKEIAAGADVHAVSAKTGYGLELLSKYLQPRNTIVFLGSSGVGKSSLVNALCGEMVMEVNEIRDSDGKGRHTTTHRQLIMLESGVMIIDTPGMRVLGMWDVTNGLGKSFSDVEQYFKKCRFKDCKHQLEPGCAVKAAIESGELSEARWKSYFNLMKEAKYAVGKTRCQRVKQKHIKSSVKETRNETKRRLLVEADEL